MDPGQRIDTYANNDGWFDDTSDGPVMARLVMYSAEVGQVRFIDVEAPAWVIVGYPAYVPQILDMVTMDEKVIDLPGDLGVGEILLIRGYLLRVLAGVAVIRILERIRFELLW